MVVGGWQSAADIAADFRLLDKEGYPGSKRTLCYQPDAAGEIFQAQLSI